MPIREIVVDQETQQRKLFFWAESIAKLDDFESWVSELSTQEQEKLARLLKQCLSHTSPLLHHSKEKFRKELLVTIEAALSEEEREIFATLCRKIVVSAAKGKEKA